MLDVAVAVHVEHFDAKAVVGILAVFQLHRGEHLFVAFGLEDGLGDEALIPQREVVGGHGQFAGGKHPAAALLGRNAEGAEGVAIVGGGVGLGELGFVGVPDGLHAERAEDVFAEEVHELFSADFLHDCAGDDVVGVGVLPLRAGIEVERLFGPGVEDLLRAFGVQHGRHDVVFGPVVLVAGGVGENLADGDFVAAGEAGDVFADRVVEGEFALLLQEQDGRGGELLGDGADGVAHVGRGGDGRIETRVAVGVGVNQLAAFDDGDGCGGDAGLLEDVVRDAVDAGFQGGVEGVDGLRMKLERNRGE